jgi:hypothetical protein
VARTRSKDELASLLTDLHVALTAQVTAWRPWLLMWAWVHWYLQCTLTSSCVGKTSPTHQPSHQAAASCYLSRCLSFVSMLCPSRDPAAQIHAEVREFWGVLETVAAARHNELLGALNAHLARLSQQVGGGRAAAGSLGHLGQP